MQGASAATVCAARLAGAWSWSTALMAVDGVVVVGFLATGTTGFMLRTSLINAPQIRACPIKALGSRRSVRRAKDEDAFLRC